MMSRAKPNSDESWVFTYLRCTDKRHRACVIWASSAGIAGPTCLWSYWWHQWAHNNWSDSTKRSVTDCPLRGTRVALDTEPVRERIHDTSKFIDTLVPFLWTLIRQGISCPWKCMCYSLDQLPDQLNPTGAFVYVFTKTDICFAFFRNEYVSIVIQPTFISRYKYKFYYVRWGRQFYGLYTNVIYFEG